LTNKPTPEDIQSTLLRLARPKMSGKELLRQVKRAHPEASKKEIVHAAFASVISVVDHDLDKAIALQDFALKGRSDSQDE
jgi:hypothetical protein